MRYKTVNDSNGNPAGIYTSESLSYQMTGRARIEMVDEGMAMIGYQDEKVFVINNDGLIIMDLRQALYERRVVSTFFRETLGKNLLVRYSRRNYRVDIYDDGKGFREFGKRKYKLTDVNKTIVVFDLRLYALGGLTKVYSPKPKQYDELGNIVRKTTSEW